MDDREQNVALAEFSALRQEIDSRSRYQQQILALQITITSGVFALGLSRPVPIAILMIVPLTSYLLCGRYVGQRTAIRWASRYIHTQLSPRVAGGLGWIRWSTDNRRPERLLDWYIPLLICFPGASLLALGWTVQAWLSPASQSAWATASLLAVWIVGLFSAAASTYLLTRIFRDRNPRIAV